MYKILVACRTGMGSSMMLKIKVEQVIRENDWDMEVDHDEISAAENFSGDILVTMADLVDDFKDKPYHVIGINNLMDKHEIKVKLEGFIKEKEGN